MITRKWMRVAMILSVFGPAVLVLGCSEDARKPERPGGKATAETEKGGGVTTADPGSPNVRPDMGTPPVSR